MNESKLNNKINNLNKFNDTKNEEKEEYVSNYMTTHPTFAREWLMKNLTQDIVEEWVSRVDSHISVSCDKKLLENCQKISTNTIQTTNEEELLTASYAEMTREGRNSVTSDLFHQIIDNTPRKNRSLISTDTNITRNQLEDKLQDMDEVDLFMKLISDITNELDINTLCHKILVNVSILTKSDRGSLFLAKGSRDVRYLEAKLFDVTPDSLLCDALNAAQQHTKIHLPFGQGIAGHVALTKENVNIIDAYQDTRFNKEMDFRTGYHTKAIMCQPILNFTGDVIGVAQCINKTKDCLQQSFTKRDEQVFKKYLTFCGIGLQNAQLFEMSVSEYKRNQLLLSLAGSIFEETSSLDTLINKIMLKAQGLLQSDKCRVYLVDIEGQQFQEEYSETIGIHINKIDHDHHYKHSQSEDIMFSTIFELQIRNNKIIKLSGINDVNCKIDVQHIQYALQVAAGGITYKCSEKYGKFISHDNSQNIEKPGMVCDNDCVLSVPIFNNDSKVIGVAQLVKIKGYQFNEMDISTLEAFSIFCGFGIHNSCLYEKALKLTAKQKVALEVLSYHASASIEETDKLMNLMIPDCDTYQLYSFEFSDFSLDERDTCLATLRMFLDLQLINTFKIPYQVLCRWILSVKKNYRPVIYHNWRHALNVTQTMFAILRTGNLYYIMNDIEKLGLIVASLCHDLDHRGTNNSYHTKTGSALATLYGTSIMENHHFNHCILILNTEGNNIFQSLSPEEYRDVIHIIESCILSTDLDQYFQKKDKFEELVKNDEKDWSNVYVKEILRGILMTACDISATFKPWDIQKKVAELVAHEFFEQGDLERQQLNQMPSAMMDREKKHELPIMQVAFIELICLPLYKNLSECWPSLSILYEGCLNNRDNWKQFSQINTLTCCDKQ
ncbi:cGMP-specific 3',5'-cyclic phosphodiesterase-like [Oppia nitens]|uniref:cGMP-specific 3',5'-cyclic phosphodiesterase-like n=1 Tax=Oppia nitens TaxID=1686743 RepID=UPI0023D9F409|nr:cGMP-specific 3',5'-cyclic phosphodiesterase-like [Oppia nitens]